MSRVVTGHGPVGETMRRRVVQAALDLGFPLAPGRENRRPVLGVVVPSLTNPVFAGMVAGIEQAAQANGLSVILGQTHYDTAREREVVAALVAERPVGLIMTVCDPSSSEALAQVVRQKLPAATVYNENVPAELAAVTVDNRAAMRHLTEALIALGHRTILFVGGRFTSSDRAACRYAGYRDALEAAGQRVLPAEEVDFLDGAEDIDLTHVLQAHAPTAIVVSNDLLALTVIASLRRVGLRVPEDISVTGLDGIDMARHMSPRLTTIVQPSRTMGVLAASMVLGIASGERRPSQMRADFTFTPGETIAPARSRRASLDRRCTAMILRGTLAALAALAGLFLLQPAPARAADVICYNCPPEWANWGEMLKDVKKDLGIEIPGDNKNSGQAIAQIIAEKASPVADIAYLGVNAGIAAASQDLVTPWKPARFAEIPDGLKDPEGRWWTVHQGTIGFFVNVDTLNGAPVPACWADLKKPEYDGLVGYLDPTSAAVGYVASVAANIALGGSLDDFTPAIGLFKALAKNNAIVTKQTSYARVVSGEIPILLDYDFNAYRAKYTEKGKFAFVLPCEGTVSFPYVMTLVKNAPHAEKAKAVLDYLLTDKGQAFWAKAYLRPALPIAMPQDIADKFLPAKDYERARTVDWSKAQAVQKGYTERYLAEVR